ncbi:MAG: hypothetical protein AAFZ15_03820 [Bacteroidota bacterium]
MNAENISVGLKQKINVTDERRKNITFILGEDEGGDENYYTSATYFYKNHPTEKTDFLIAHCRSILEVRNYLVENFSKGQMPWGKINLVVHGNEWSGLGVATLPDGKRTTIRSINEALHEGVLKPLPKEVVDDCSEFHIHGCAVGKNKELLGVLGKALGTKQVFSSNYFLRYELHEGGKNCQRTQLKSWYVFYPKTYRPSDEKLIADFQKKYPGEKMDWEDALSRDLPRNASDIYHHTFNVPVLWTVAYADKQSVPDLTKWKAQKKWLREQAELQNLLKEYGIPWEHFQWTFLNVDHELEDGRKVPAVKAIGLCTVLTVLKPLEDISI